jgi:hypothetical protein
VQLVDLAKEHRADAMAAAEQGRLVREVRRGRQNRAEEMCTSLAVRDLGRRLWGWWLAHSPGRELEVAEAAIVNLFSDAARITGLTADVAVRLEGAGLVLEAPGGHQMVCRRIGVSDRRAQVRAFPNANGRRKLSSATRRVMADDPASAAPTVGSLHVERE